MSLLGEVEGEEGEDDDWEDDEDDAVGGELSVAPSSLGGLTTTGRN